MGPKTERIFVAPTIAFELWPMSGNTKQFCLAARFTIEVGSFQVVREYFENIGII